MPLLVRLVTWGIALVGLIVVATAGWLWFEARPVLAEARAQYEALPEDRQCIGRGATWPPGYPHSAREVQTMQHAQLSVYRLACAERGLTDRCFYMSGAARSIGFSVYRRAYLSDCAMRAVDLNGDTTLRHALDELYPERDPSELSEPELTCLALRLRQGRGSLCSRHPHCCVVAQEGLTPGAEAPR